MVAAAGQAHAAAAKYINIYGASAQKAFWGELGVPYLTASAATGGAGCKSAVKAAYSADSNFGVIRGTQCSTNGNGSIIITYGSVASLEGIKAAKEVAPIDDKNSCAATYGNKYRQVVDDSTCNWTGDLKCASVKCADITLGASDVAGISFNQESHGGKNGYIDTTPFDVVLAAEKTNGLATYRPTVVPFGFFMNNDANAYPALANLTRTQAANLFAGNVKDWSQFGPDFPQKGVVVCLRHAGSGTHASLDTGVMRGDLKLTTQEQIMASPGSFPEIMFFQSSSGEAQCVAENGGYGAGGDYIAVGYADSDLTTNTGNGMHLVKYEGADSTADNIANGVYSFWSSQWIYLKPVDNNAHVKRIMAYAAANVPASKVGVWLPAADLNVQKATDKSMPVLQ
jgi:hypothetical protein